jgi:DNA repair exonuclease SbcCD ATPase subunit
MAAHQNPPNQDGPRRLRAISTPATDSDLNELLAGLASEIKALRRENKQLASSNSRLVVVLAEQAGVVPPEPEPGDGLLTPEAATAGQLMDELRRRLGMLQEEGQALREENARLIELVRQLDLPAWRIEETRIGTSRLVPGPRAFIRRRRVEPTTLPRRGREL